jgi:prolyl 4-hydroxylase
MVPRLSPRGFEKVPCPAEAWRLIEAAYRALLPTMAPENFAGKDVYIPGTDTSDLICLDQDPAAIRAILRELHQPAQQFAGRDLTPLGIYGIRSYKTGATLTPHTDRAETHHIGIMIVVDKDLQGAPDWPLEIQDHGGQWHHLHVAPGEMVIYEAATCQHGRMKSFEGRWYRNLFAHFTIAD